MFFVRTTIKFRVRGVALLQEMTEWWLIFARFIFQFPWKLHRVAEDDRFREGQSTFWCVVRVRVRNSVRYSGARQVVRIFWLNHLWQLLELGTGAAQHCAVCRIWLLRSGIWRVICGTEIRTRTRIFKISFCNPSLSFCWSQVSHIMLSISPLDTLYHFAHIMTLQWGLSRCYDDGSTKDLSVSPSVVH